MKSLQARFWILFIFLLISAGLSMNHLLHSGGQEAVVDLGRIIPHEIGDWYGEDLALQPGTLRLLGTENVLLRTYKTRTGSFEPVFFCLTFSAGSHRVAHPPEVCYEGQGWSVDRNEESIMKLPGGKSEMRVQRLSISREGRAQEVIIWFRNASDQTSSYLKQKVNMLLGSLFGSNQWTAMIRLSAAAEPGDAQPALNALSDFTAGLLPHLDTLSREVESP